MNNNISIDVNENENEFINTPDLNKLLDEINNNYFGSLSNNLFYTNENEKKQVKSIDYQMNYNVKELFIICDYYGITKNINKRCKKEELINVLVNFEEDDNNSFMVYKRKQLWYYMSELKNDKFMKKYIIW